jgi:hypothetical protein
MCPELNTAGITRYGTVPESKLSLMMQELLNLPSIKSIRQRNVAIVGRCQVYYSVS